MAVSADHGDARLLNRGPRLERDAVQRTRAFRRARRHSMLVRLLRVSFPVSVVVLSVGYAALLEHTVSINTGSGKISASGVTISTEELVAENPSYQGFGKAGSRYVVNAKTAEQDIQQTGPVQLKTIDGVLTDANNSHTHLTSPRGAYNTKTNVLELFDRVDIVADSGMRAELKQATIQTKEGRIVSTQPVAVHTPSGTVLGNELEILQKEKLAVFRRGVQSRLVPAEGSPQAAATTGGGLGLTGGRNGPVTVNSSELVINDATKIATFQGDVVATQGEATLRTSVLQAQYEGGAQGQSTAGPETSDPNKTAGGPATGQSHVKRIVIPGQLDIVQGNDRVRADSGDFDTVADTGVLVGNVVVTSGAEGKAVGDKIDLDNRQDTILLTGSVLVSQGKDILRGRRLLVDRRTGKSQLTTPPEPGIARGRISARFFQTNADPANPAAHAPATKTGEQDPLMLAMRTDPSKPIDIEADQLDGDDKAKTATFKGQVHVVQGDYTMTSAELVATYTGDTGLTMGGAAGASLPGGKAPPGQGAQIQKVIARQKVLVVSKDGQSATGDWADFDTKANRVVLGGNVTLSQQGTVVTGERALIDMNTGLFRMVPVDPSAPVAKTGPNAKTIEDAAKALAPVAKKFGDAVKEAAPGAIVKGPGGRPALLLYPDEARQAAKKGVQAVAPEVGKDVKKGAASPQTSGWSSTVNGTSGQ